MFLKHFMLGIDQTGDGTVLYGFKVLGRVVGVLSFPCKKCPIANALLCLFLSWNM